MEQIYLMSIKYEDNEISRKRKDNMESKSLKTALGTIIPSAVLGFGFN